MALALPDDDADFDMPPKKVGVLAASSQKKRDKSKEGSGSSRAPKPSSVHVQSIGGGSATTAELAAAIGAGPTTAGGAGPSASPPPRPSAPFAPLAVNALPASPTPKKAAAKRKACSTPEGEDDDDGDREAVSKPKPKAARTPPKAATPKSPGASAGTPNGAAGGRLAEGDVAGQVERFLLSRNKPLNAQMISDGLLGDGLKASKAAVEKQLAVLVEKGSINTGEWGKAKLWWPNQEAIASECDDGIEEKIAALQARIPGLKAAGQAKARELADRSKMVPFDQLQSQIADEEAACSALELRISARAAVAGSGSEKALTPAEAKKVRAQHEKYLREWARRKRMLLDALQQYCESSGKKLPALVEEMGIELDEDVGVDLLQLGVKCKWPSK